MISSVSKVIITTVLVVGSIGLAPSCLLRCRERRVVFRAMLLARPDVNVRVKGARASAQNEGSCRCGVAGVTCRGVLEVEMVAESPLAREGRQPNASFDFLRVQQERALCLARLSSSQLAISTMALAPSRRPSRREQHLRCAWILVNRPAARLSRVHHPARARHCHHRSSPPTAITVYRLRQPVCVRAT